MQARYRGRFAPSPTGPLHFGSLVAAVGSYLQAKSQKGEWCVRIEDVDSPRSIDGASRQIIETLEAYGFEWDGPVIYQQSRLAAYQDALHLLTQKKLTYPCSCSRKEITESSSRGMQDGIYPGTCLTRSPKKNKSPAIRIKTDYSVISFNDTVQGLFGQTLRSEVGDFIIFRSDDIFAYHLAVVVDDHEQAISEVVRGSDLLDSTPRQIYLQRLLGFSTPGYVHLPVVVDHHGNKLSKQTFAAPLNPQRPLPTLYYVLMFLGQQPPTDLLEGDIGALWQWATHHWRIDKVPQVRRLPFDDKFGFLDQKPLN